MSDLMRWLYTHYIRDQVENQPRDDGEAMWFDLLKNGLEPHQDEAYRAVCAFYAVQGFRLGVKTGLALGEDLRLL